MAENVEMHNVADYWQIALGGSSYTPKVHGKHVASHPKTVAQAMRIAGQRCPEVADVIAALVWKMSLAENRAEWVSKVSDETRAEAAATLTALRARIEELERVGRETSEYLRKLEANMLENDADMMLDDCLPPSFHADQIDAALRAKGGEHGE